MEDIPHGVPGQINTVVLDKDSDITGHGAHNRIIVFRGIGADGNIITAREDIRDFPESTDAQRRKVMNGWQRMHPKGSRLVHEGSVRYQGHQGECIEHTYRITRP